MNCKRYHTASAFMNSSPQGEGLAKSPPRKVVTLNRPHTLPHIPSGHSIGRYCFVVSRNTANHSLAATSPRRFSKAARGVLMSGLSSFARVCIRLIIAREIVGVAIISFVSTGAICVAVWQMVGCP